MSNTNTLIHIQIKPASLSQILTQQTMNRKTSSQKPQFLETKPCKNEKQSIEFLAAVKRESTFFSRWKDKYALIVYLPNEQFSLTLYNKDKHSIDEIINLHLTKVSKRCSNVQSTFCFGLETTSGRRYVIGGKNEQTVLAAFQLVSGVKKLLKEKKQSANTSKISSKEQDKPQKHYLQFQKSNDSQQDQSNQRKQDEPKMLISTNYTPLNQACELQYERQQEKSEIMQIQREDQYCTVIQEEPIIIEEQQPLHLKMPVDQQQLQYIQSDDGFKLLQTFSQGRILQKGKRLIKANLLFKTYLTCEQLLESFFHMQLWNQKVKNYKLANRIDEGIYLIELQFVKQSWFSCTKVCYLMLTTLMLKNEPYLIMRSLQQSNFQRQKNKEWINFSLWLKVRGEDSSKLYKFVSLCASVENDKDFDLLLPFLQELKYYQSFLLTTNKTPTKVLQWRPEQNDQFIQ